jgi:hypothetical protein
MMGASKGVMSTAPTIAYDVYITPNPAIRFGFNGSLTTGNVTANAENGLEPYTYAWSFVSGDTSISISSTTSEVVTFSASGTDENKQAVWKCAVTDASPAVLEDTLTVTFIFEGA